MIQPARIVLREIHLPLVEPFRSASGTVVHRRVVLLELIDRDGVSAWSECVAEALPTYSPDTVDTCWLAIRDWLAPRVLGRSFAAPQEVDAILALGVRGHRMARAAVEMAVWALSAIRQERSLASLLGEASGFARASRAKPREQVEAGIALGMYESPDALVARVEAAAAEGYRRIKLKIEPGRDVGYVGAVRESLGDAVRLSVDANCSYSLDDAGHVHALEAMDDFRLVMVEQPLAHDDLRRHALLQRRLSTPICLDESIAGVASAEDMLELGSARMVNLKPGRVGGFAEAIGVHDVCSRAGVPVWCGGMLETGIGRAYNVALASLPGFSEPGDLSPSARYWARDVITSPWTMDGEGRVRVPLDRAGIGVDVDEGFIDELTVRRDVIAAGSWNGGEERS
jgi:O-succinylbenzoate synthase